MAASLSAAAQTKTEVSAATVERVLNALAADDMQGRATGQPGSVKASDFLAAEFTRIGFAATAGPSKFHAGVSGV